MSVLKLMTSKTIVVFKTLPLLLQFFLLSLAPISILGLSVFLYHTLDPLLFETILLLFFSIAAGTIFFFYGYYLWKPERGQKRTDPFMQFLGILVATAGFAFFGMSLYHVHTIIQFL